MLAGQTPYVAGSGTEMLIMHLTATPRPYASWRRMFRCTLRQAITRRCRESRDERFESIASFMAAIRGEAGAAALDRPSLSDEMPAMAAVQRLFPPDSGRPSKTTFSHANREIKAADDDDMLLQASRTPRWPLYAGGGAAAVGLMLFLLLRPSHEAAPQATPATAKVAAPGPAVVAAVLPARQEAPRDAAWRRRLFFPAERPVGRGSGGDEARPSAKLAHAGASNRRRGRRRKKRFRSSSVRRPRPVATTLPRLREGKTTLRVLNDVLRKGAMSDAWQAW